MTQNTWKNSASGQWGTSGNWIGGIPNSTTADATIAAAGGYTVTLATGSTFTADSVLVDDSTANFSLAGGLILAGTAADFTFDGKDFFLLGTIAGGTLDIDTGTLVNKGGIINTADFTLGGSASLALGGTALTLSQTAELDGYIYGNNSAGNSLVITGAANLGDGVYVENNATILDAGTLTANTEIQLGNSAADKSSLLVQSGAYFQLIANAGIAENGIGSIANAGLFEGSSSDAIAARFNNSGTLQADGGDILYLQNGGALGGTLTGAGEIDLDGANFTLAPGIVISIATLGLDAGTASLSGNLVYGGSFSGGGGSIVLDGYNLTLTGNVSLNGEFDGLGTVFVDGTAFIPANST